MPPVIYTKPANGGKPQAVEDLDSEMQRAVEWLWKLCEARGLDGVWVLADHGTPFEEPEKCCYELEREDG